MSHTVTPQSGVETDKPPEHDSLVRLITQSLSEPGNSPTHETAIKHTIEYLRKYKNNPHWFCNRYMYSIACYSLILFSFPNNAVLEELKPDIAKSLSKCTSCLRAFAIAKTQLRSGFITNKKTPIANVNQFINAITSWEATLVQPCLNLVYNNLETIEKVQAQLHLCRDWFMVNPDLLRHYKDNKEKFAHIVRVLRAKDELPTSPALLAGLVYLLFEGSGEEKLWAFEWMKHLSQQKIIYNKRSLEEPVVKEFSIHLYRIQDSKYFNDGTAIKFWEIVYNILDFMDDEAFILRVNTPKDIRAMSEHTNLKLYSAISVLCNSLMSNLTAPLPVLLKVFTKLLNRLGSKLYSHTMPLTPIALLSGILGNPEYSKQLILSASEKSSLNDFSFQDFISWIFLFIESLNGSQRQNACMKIGPYLLRQGKGYTSSTNDLRSQRVTNLRELGVKIFAGIFPATVVEMNPKDPKLSVEIMSFRDVRAALEYEAGAILSCAMNSPPCADAMDLVCRCLKYDVLILVKNSYLLSKGEIPNMFDTFPFFWSAILKSKLYTNIGLVKVVIQCLRLMPMAINFNEIKYNQANKDLASAKTQHNKGMEAICDLQNQIFSSFSLCDPENIKQIINDLDCAESVWGCIFTPLISQAALDFMNEVYNASGRLETFQECFSNNLKSSLVSININLANLTNLACYEPTPKAIRIVMDIIKALADPVDSSLLSSTTNCESEIISFWKNCWKFLIMVFQETFVWAGQFHLDELLEFARDTLDLSHLLLDSFRFIVDTIKEQTNKDISYEFFESFMNAFQHIIVWLKLGDLSLLNSCVALVIKGFDLASEENFKVQDQFVEQLWKYSKKVKGYNNKLSESQRMMLMTKARELNEVLVETMEGKESEQKYAQARAKVEPKLQPIDDEIQELRPEEFAKRTNKRQQTLEGFVSFTNKAPVAPAPKEVKGTQNLNSIRQKLQQSRSSISGPPKSHINPAPPRPAGFNSKKSPPSAPSVAIGRPLHALKKKTAADSESSSEDESDTDLTDLFVEGKAKKIAKITEVDMNLKTIDRNNLQKRRKQIDEAKMAKERMRLRLNVNLKPLYLSVLRWNYNSKSDFPSKDKSIYQEIKDTYKDVKEYVQVTEPLLMLECWSAMQSAKLTVDEKPFELLIGSRTSVDGFFDVFASMEKAVLQDRRIGDSDLVVLALKNESLQHEAEIRRYIKAEDTMTCLAKVQDTKYTNSDYCDVILRVYPSGPMMGALTPKSVVTGMKVMQMITIEREFSSLKGLQYYDLADSIISATPNKPIEIEEEDAEKMRKIYHVNDSQARAIMGTFKSEGFSLIQGPPGTGKTKTILGIVGYSLSQEKNKKVIDISESGSSPAPSDKAKILICAPSNAAVDELVLRLRDGVRNSSGEHMPLKVVRLGRSDAINSSVRDLTLEELVDKELQTKQTEVVIDPNIRLEHTKCINERDELRKRLATESLEDKDITELEEKIRAINKKRSELAKKLDEQREKASIANRTKEINRRNIQARILSEAQVLCSTLSGSAHDLVANLSVQFDQVIIDEACQCLELSAIIPLRYGCRKCIMVGDPNQLPPTVLSQAAASYNYEQSLFVRMQKNHPDSVYMLDVQYRMHPMISKFPSSEFYNSKLKDGDNMLELNTRPWHKDPPLTPYRFFDILGKHEKNELTRSLFNTDEAMVALQLTDKLMQIIPQDKFSGNVGIISPYKEQIRKIKEVFVRKYGKPILDEIDFNTVDGFQGQEKEIIIMSCVRASATGNVGFLSDVRRMNVALTRAKTTLWILGNKESLSRNEVWRKLLTDADERKCVTQAYPGFLNSSNPVLKRKEASVFIPPQEKYAKKQKVSNESERNVQKIRNSMTMPAYRVTNAGVLPSKTKPPNGNKNFNYQTKNSQPTNNAPKPYINQPKPQDDSKNVPTRSGTISKPVAASTPTPTSSGTLKPNKPADAERSTSKEFPTTPQNKSLQITVNSSIASVKSTDKTKKPTKSTMPSSSGVVKPPSNLFIPRKRPFAKK
ncbi:helicase, putative [Candida dubliniensis CD36]|uniref:Helicase, putative n=1 Tax=Candida dubliniensis (strain CD36 / ATCC MYA-646 / CBS 7987 / NCPF 3949 / NRRL Y-17841) TaxID=573826 RepID=B9WE67_CANDC|nr:helicase, putative [Candida dubliniensis CD36]CAX42978.1 helicase, putative [Candida dubliniensis CD36]